MGTSPRPSVDQSELKLQTRIINALGQALGKHLREQAEVIARLEGRVRLLEELLMRGGVRPPD